MGRKRRTIADDKRWTNSLWFSIFEKALVERQKRDYPLTSGNLLDGFCELLKWSPDIVAESPLAQGGEFPLPHYTSSRLVVDARDDWTFTAAAAACLGYWGVQVHRYRRYPEKNGITSEQLYDGRWRVIPQDFLDWSRPQLICPEMSAVLVLVDEHQMADWSRARGGAQYIEEMASALIEHKRLLSPGSLWIATFSGVTTCLKKAYASLGAESGLRCSADDTSIRWEWLIGASLPQGLPTGTTPRCCGLSGEKILAFRRSLSGFRSRAQTREKQTLKTLSSPSAQGKSGRSKSLASALAV